MAGGGTVRRARLARIHLRAFAPALGEKGIADIAAQVEARAASAAPDSWSAQFSVRDFREQLAELTGDVDHYVAVLAEDLKSPEQYQKITLALVAADRTAEAAAWARRGLAHHPGNPYSERLRDLLVDLLLDDDQPADALEVRIAEFNRHPVAATYRALAATCERIGDTAPLASALDELRARATADPNRLSELVRPSRWRAWTTRPGPPPPPIPTRSARFCCTASSNSARPPTPPTCCPPTDTSSRPSSPTPASTATTARSSCCAACAPPTPQLATQTDSATTSPNYGTSTSARPPSSPNSTRPA